MNAKNKYFRFFIVEQKFRMRLGVFFVSLVIIVLQLKMIQAQETEFSKIQSEKKLIMRIGDLERKLNIKSTRVKPRPERKNLTSKNGNVLKGTEIQGSISYALINSGVYKEGDSIHNYIVHLL